MMTFQISQMETVRSTNYLVQHGCGDCGEMLKITRPYHEKVCKAHGVGYLPYLGAIPINKGRAEWMKLKLLNHLLPRLPEDCNVIWMDADAVWTLPQENLFDAFKAYNVTHLGMVKCYYRRKWRYNTGVMLIKNNQQTRDFLKLCYDMGPGIGMPAHDEGRINHEIDYGKHPITVVELPHKYNLCKYNLVVDNAQNRREVNMRPIKDAVIKAWHGTPRDTAIKRIREEMTVLKGEYPQYA